MEWTTDYTGTSDAPAGRANPRYAAIGFKVCPLPRYTGQLLNHKWIGESGL